MVMDAALKSASRSGPSALQAKYVPTGRHAALTAWDFVVLN